MIFHIYSCLFDLQETQPHPQLEFSPISNVSVAVGEDATLTCKIRQSEGYMVS